MFNNLNSTNKILLINMSISFKIPNDNVARTEITPIITNNMLLALILEILQFSINDAMGTSRMLMPDVMAANKSNIKNKIETMFPKGIWAKICGKVTKTKPAPEFGSKPKENIAGKSIIPAISANIVSNKIIVYALFAIFLSSLI